MIKTYCLFIRSNYYGLQLKFCFFIKKIMNLKYKVYPERKLLVDVFEGELRISDIQKINQDEKGNVDFTKINKSISDIRKARLRISLKEVKDFIKKMKPANTNKDTKWAILTQNQIQTILALMLRIDSRYKNNVRVFLSLNDCNNFLGINYSEKEFDDDDFVFVK